ncbi:hypothetical protein COCCADRAFT_111827, partial [Bipolaris zeicola 26-R-13]
EGGRIPPFSTRFCASLVSWAEIPVEQVCIHLSYRRRNMKNRIIVVITFVFVVIAFISFSLGQEVT